MAKRKDENVPGRGTMDEVAFALGAKPPAAPFPIEQAQAESVPLNEQTYDAWFGQGAFRDPSVVGAAKPKDGGRT